MTLAQELEKDEKLAGSFFFDKRITQNKLGDALNVRN